MTKRRVRKDTRWKFMKFIFFFYAVVGMFSLIWLRTSVVNLEYELSELGKQKTELVREGRLILAEKANFYSIENIEEVSIKRLGMSHPKRENIYFVKATTGAAPYKVSAESVHRDD